MEGYKANPDDLTDTCIEVACDEGNHFEKSFYEDCACKEGYLLVDGSCEIASDHGCSVAREKLCTECLDGYALTKN